MAEFQRKGMNAQQRSKKYPVGFVSVGVVLFVVLTLASSFLGTPAAHAQSTSRQKAGIATSSCSQASHTWSSSTDVYWYLNTCDANAYEQALNNGGGWALGAGAYFGGPELKWALFFAAPFAWGTSYTLWSTDKQCGWNGVLIDESFLYSSVSGLPSVYIEPVC